MSTTTTSEADVETKTRSTSVAAGQTIVLTDVDWELYVRLRDTPGNRRKRMTFADGTLEIMTLSSFHELISLIIDHFILEWRVARDISVLPAGSMTLRRTSLSRGLEADQMYYIENEERVRNQVTIDLDQVPPPDLVIEVEHTSSAIPKLPLYAQLGVPEVWCWCQETLSVYRLVEGDYQAQTASTALAGFPLDQLRAALLQRTQVSETTLVRNFRQWIQDNG